MLKKDEDYQDIAVAPDDIATSEDLADIKIADAEFARGEFVRHEDIDWS